MPGHALEKRSSDQLQPVPTSGHWLAPLLGSMAVKAEDYQGDVLSANWLPSAAVAKAWMQYTVDCNVTDTSPPPAPTQIEIKEQVLTWQATADLESGLAGFIIRRDGQEIARIPENNKSPFGRPIFQKNSYSDTPSQPLVRMEYTDTAAPPGQHKYEVIAVNTVGLTSDK